MALSVTVKGASASTVTVTLTSSLNYAFAQAFASVVNNASGLVATNYAAGLPSVPAGTNELVIGSDPGGPVTIPSGYTYITDPLSTPVTVTGSGDAGTTINVLAGQGGITYQAGASESVALIAGGGSQDFNGSSTGSGSYLVVFDAGASTINAGGAAGSTGEFFTGAGNSAIALGAASDTVVSGGTDTIAGGTGSDVYFLNGSGASVTGSSGTDTIIDNGTGDSVTTGAGANTLFAFGSGGSYSLAGPTLLVSGTGSDSITVASAGATIFGGTGPMSIAAGAQGFEFISGAGSTTVNATSAETLYGSSGGAITYSSSATGGFLVAGAGNESLTASGTGTGLYIVGGTDSTGQNVLTGNGANDTIESGAGFNTLVGAAGGGDTFQFIKSITSVAGHAVTVQNFSTTDFINLAGYGSGAAAYTITAGTGGSSTIKLSDRTQINISGVTPTTSQIQTF